MYVGWILPTQLCHAMVSKTFSQNAMVKHEDCSEQISKWCLLRMFYCFQTAYVEFQFFSLAKSRKLIGNARSVKSLHWSDRTSNPIDISVWLTWNKQTFMRKFGFYCYIDPTQCWLISKLTLRRMYGRKTSRTPVTILEFHFNFPRISTAASEPRRRQKGPSPLKFSRKAYPLRQWHPNSVRGTVIPWILSEGDHGV